MFDHALLASILVSLSILTVPCGSAQTAQQQQGGSGGMATGGVFQPVYDSAKRPITAGGTVKTGPVVFMNTAEQAGLTNWHHTAGTPEKRFILEAKGPGVALLRPERKLDVRQIAVEAACWSYRLRPGVGHALRKRQEGVPEEIKEIAWKAQHRLHKRYCRLAAANKDQRKITTAVGRELLGFIWAIGIKAEAASKLRMAAWPRTRTNTKTFQRMKKQKNDH